MCEPKLDQSFWSKTIHSQSSEFVPAESFQSEFPDSVSAFLTNVWSFVALLTPQTSQPDPGSPFLSPIQSKTS